MSTQRYTSPEFVAELFKLLRAKPLTTRRISEAMGCSVTTVEHWCDEFEANGMLVTRVGGDDDRLSRNGRLPMVYALAPEWGGPAT